MFCKLSVLLINIFDFDVSIPCKYDDVFLLLLSNGKRN